MNLLQRALLLTLLLGASLQANLGNNRGIECCTEYVKHRVRLSLLMSFHETSYSCFKRAIVFSTERKLVCADPRLKWVQKAITYIKELKKK
uniref:C-C motif chemokine 22 n=1 Tax=Geotrypetes seraphini TaxID=260995 RepID=A0A6P8QK01_GEOSA|nr:C-C motif chemokine 22 [Geotrypetes seraphini]